jgi:hypothetical protein
VLLVLDVGVGVGVEVLDVHVEVLDVHVGVGVEVPFRSPVVVQVSITL